MYSTTSLSRTHQEISFPAQTQRHCTSTVKPYKRFPPALSLVMIKTWSNTVSASRFYNQNVSMPTASYMHENKRVITKTICVTTDDRDMFHDHHNVSSRALLLEFTNCYVSTVRLPAWCSHSFVDYRTDISNLAPG